jgi:hypothetical protein
MDDDQDDVVPLSRTATACSAIEKLRDLMRDPAVTGSPRHPTPPPPADTSAVPVDGGEEGAGSHKSGGKSSALSTPQSSLAPRSRNDPSSP